MSLLASHRALVSAVAGINERIGEFYTASKQRQTAAENGISALGAMVGLLKEQLAKHDAAAQALAFELRTLNDNSQKQRLALNNLEEAGRAARSSVELLQRQIQVQETIVRETSERLGPILPAEVFDPFYTAFEDEFRGSRAEIKAKMQDYIPCLQERNLGGEASPVLDLGCGRGEWLECLAAANIKAYGVDGNVSMIAECQKLNLNAILGDALAHVRSLADKSVGAISAFHLVEHLPFPSLLLLLKECKRVLCDNGLLILETPNPQNVIVGACNFYIDPTHQNPIPPMTLRFLVEYSGFEKVELIPKHPFGDEHHFQNPKTDIEQKLDQFFFGAQDYAVLASNSSAEQI